MGMFDWFKTHKQLDKEWIENRGLPTPTRSAPPMPKCVAPKTNISDTAIELLGMLARYDDWDIEERGAMDYDITYKGKSQLVFRVYTRIKLNGGVQYGLYFPWTTYEESDAINKAVSNMLSIRIAERNRLAREKSRKEFAELLKGTDEKILS